MKRRLTRWRDRRIILPIRKAIFAGVSAEKLSVSLALGLTLGLIPLYGITTLLVGAVALSLRLNFVSMQIAHFIVHPLQIALIIPFLKLGNALFIKADYIYTIQEYFNLFQTNFWFALKTLWKVNLSAVAIWLIISIPLFIILYYLLKSTFQKIYLRYPHSKN